MLRAMSGYSKQSVNISCCDNINNIIKSSPQPFIRKPQRWAEKHRLLPSHLPVPQTPSEDESQPILTKTHPHHFLFSLSNAHTLTYKHSSYRRVTRSGRSLNQGHTARQEQRWGLKQRQCKDFLEESPPQALQSSFTNSPNPMDVFTEYAMQYSFQPPFQPDG